MKNLKLVANARRRNLYKISICVRREGSRGSFFIGVKIAALRNTNIGVARIKKEYLTMEKEGGVVKRKCFAYRRKDTILEEKKKNRGGLFGWV